MKSSTMLAATIIAMTVALPINAQSLKKCVDAKGKVTYSDQACVAGDTATSLSVSAAAPSAPTSQNINVQVTQNMRMLRACELGKKEACFEKQTVEKRCLLQRKQGSGIPLSDCKAFEAERSRFQELSSSCKKEKQEDACLILSCADGDASSCGRMKAVGEKQQQGLEKRIEDAQKQGLPSGYGWFMSQGWNTSSDGRQAAIVTCNNPGKANNGNRSVVLRKVPPMSHRILISTTGDEFFTTVEDAARKACSKV